MKNNLPKPQYNEYKSRINRVLDYIDSNVKNNITLDELAKVANFSKFHFNRIFHSFTGETIYQFIQRVRMEKIATILKMNPNISITEVAFDYGFSSNAVFSRSFKKQFDMSASEWRTKIVSDSNNCKVESNNEQLKSTYSKELVPSVDYNIIYQNNIISWRIKLNNKEINVEVKNLDEMTVAYVRHIGPYKGDGDLFGQLFTKLYTWAGPRGLIKFPETESVIVYHDDPEITEEAKLRTSVCITVPEDTKVDGEIGMMKVSAGKYAVGRFELAPSDFVEAWKFMYGTWLPNSGFAPDDKPCIEIYPSDKNDPENCTGIFVVDICIPVKPL